MACPITVAKFVGTISLGLLTGVSYSVSNIAIPTLQALPTASNAANALKNLQTRTRRRVLRFSTAAAISLVTAFSMSSPRRKHPYLIWTSLFALIGGSGLEWWSTGSIKTVCCASVCCGSSGGSSWVGSWVATRFGCGSKKSSKTTIEEDLSSNGASSEIEIVDVADAQSAGASATGTPAPEEADVNGESVQREMIRERRLQKVRTLILGLGFSMGVVGIWGDGA